MASSLRGHATGFRTSIVSFAVPCSAITLGPASPWDFDEEDGGSEKFEAEDTFEKEGDRLRVYRETDSWVEVGESFRMSGFAFRGWVARESVIVTARRG